MSFRREERALTATTSPDPDATAPDHDPVTVVRAFDAQRILADADHADRPYAAWAERAGRRSVVSLEELDSVTLRCIAGPTFEVERRDDSRVSRVTLAPLPPAEEPESIVTPSGRRARRMHLATTGAVFLVLLLVCAAVAIGRASTTPSTLVQAQSAAR